MPKASTWQVEVRYSRSGTRPTIGPSDSSMRSLVSSTVGPVRSKAAGWPPPAYSICRVDL